METPECSIALFKADELAAEIGQVAQDKIIADGEAGLRRRHSDWQWRATKPPLAAPTKEPTRGE